MNAWKSRNTAMKLIKVYIAVLKMKAGLYEKLNHSHPGLPRSLEVEQKAMIEFI